MSRKSNFKKLGQYIVIKGSGNEYRPGKREGLQYCHRCGKTRHVVGVAPVFVCPGCRQTNRWVGPLWSEHP
jgi:tRNA G26 N,N-dimethylase Trm1